MEAIVVAPEALVRIRRRIRTGEARTIRMSAGLSLAEVSEPLGVSPSTVFRWERGARSPHGDHAVEYGALLDRIAGEL